MSMVWSIQQQSFSTEIAEISSKDPNPSLKGLAKLSPFLDVTCNRELLRVGGRIRNSDENYDVKFPIILPGDSHFVKQYIRHLHIQNYHAGPQALLSFIRDRFWVTNARPLVRSIIFKCVHCNKYRPKLFDQVMGNLPKDRVTPGRPFEICGVDFCGPMLTSWKIRVRCR
ncbi:uncharacterized protein LOC129910603 [Episyrphus balteatus]|uniref:uncharacterized protein LOC129910603 n=1 Tax=Episyrphus balteatus TaxID=286459 RepID=UPI002486422A|nr:uncharacterized protein LOC129910603 [Episyrphus balteatus]